jgi:hypothetical protein
VTDLPRKKLHLAVLPPLPALIGKHGSEKLKPFSIPWEFRTQRNPKGMLVSVD